MDNNQLKESFSKLNIPELSVDKINKRMRHDLLVDLYANNKDKPEQKDLVEKISQQYKELYNYDINKTKRGLKTAFVTSENIDVNSIYLEEAKKMCNGLGLNIVIDPSPDYEIKSNDYLILTSNIQKLDPIEPGKPRFVEGTTNVLAPASQNFEEGSINRSYGLLRKSIGGLVLNKNLSNMIPIEENFFLGLVQGTLSSLHSVGKVNATQTIAINVENLPFSMPALMTRANIYKVPDEPFIENVLDRAKEIRRKSLETLNVLDASPKGPGA